MAQTQDGLWKGYRGYTVLEHLRVCDVFAGLEATDMGAAGPWKPPSTSCNLKMFGSCVPVKQIQCQLGCDTF